MNKGSDLLVAALESEGVERIFAVPGEENLDVVESLHGSKIELIVTRHEQAAAFMAATYGRLTSKPGVCLSTLGPGALNFSTAAAYALLGAMPMVLITGQKGILTSKQARFQIVDVVSSMTPLTKMARQIVSTATIPTIVREAFRSHSRSAQDLCTWSCRRTSPTSRCLTFLLFRRIRSKSQWRLRLAWTAPPP